MLERFSDWWSHENTHLRSVGSAALPALICMLVALFGVPRMRIYGHDIFIALDGAWRVLHGQRPVVDFFAQMGPLYYLLPALGMWFAKGAAKGLGYGTTLSAVAIALWSYALLRRRTTSAVFLFAPAALVLLAVAPYPLAVNPVNTSWEGCYNRYGYTMASLVLLECFLPLRDEEHTQPIKYVLGGFSSGLACSIGFFFKISFGLIGLGFVALSLLLRPNRIARTTGILLGLVAVTLPMLGYLRFDLPALFREYHQLAVVRGSTLGLRNIAHQLFADRIEVSLTPLLVLVTSFLPGVTERRRFQLCCLALASAGAGILLEMTNTPASLFPLNTAVAIVVLNEICRTRTPAGSPIPALVAAPVLAFALFIAGVPTLLDAAGVIAAVADKWVRPHSGSELNIPHLAGIEFRDIRRKEGDAIDTNDNGRAFVQYTEDGLALLRANSRDNESVRGLGMSNPFSYALLRPPAHGGTPVMSGTDVSTTAIPPASWIFGDAGLLLIPKFPATERDTLKSILDHYPDVLGSTYVPVAESSAWKLYRRAR
jgi:hypothetical protein